MPRSVSNETETTTGNQRVRIAELEEQVKKMKAQMRELDDWPLKALDIAAHISSQELRIEFVRMVKARYEIKNQCERLQNEKRECEDELERCRINSAREQREMREEIMKLREDFGGVQRQNASLQRQLHESNLVQSRGKARQTAPRKRQRSQSSDPEAEYSPHKRVRAGFSRERIKAVLGGIDRGWGSTRSHPKGNITYTHHVLLDVCRHLFGQKPSREQDVDEAVFGFGVVDNKIICGGIIFPLFISNHEKGRCSFTYLGNYTATKLEPVTWDELSNEGVESAVKIVQSKGFSADRNICREEKKMELEEIRDLFGVPCSRLEFQRFDERLNAAIQESTGRPRP